MHLSIYSLQKTLYEGTALSVNCKTQMGEITVLDHHHPMVSVLSEGVMKVVDLEHKEHYIPARGGFLEVQAGNKARLIIEE